jgi:hypothetical protein
MKMGMIKVYGYSKKFKVNGRTREFICNEAYPTKVEAEERAEYIRKNGNYCRIYRTSAVPGVGRQYTYKLFVYKPGRS